MFTLGITTINHSLRLFALKHITTNDNDNNNNYYFTCVLFTTMSSLIIPATCTQLNWVEADLHLPLLLRHHEFITW